MTIEAFASALEGNLATYTASIYRLDALGIAPIEPIVDLVPGYSPLRVTFDMVDQESATYDYDVTEHSIQSAVDISSNVRKRLESITITGTLAATGPLLPLVQQPAFAGVTRLDRRRVRNLKAIADAKSLVMVVTPRIGLAKAVITQITDPWTPDQGESSMVTISVRQVRLVSPITGDLIAPDYPAQEAGNNVRSGGGQSATTAVNQTATPSATTGVAPSVA